jgi:hypothetical protein
MQRKFLATVLRNGFFLKAALYSVLLMAMIVGFTGCDDGTSERRENSILGITLEKANGDAVWIGDDLDINEERASVTLSVRPGEDVTALIPRLQLSPGATVVPEPPATPVDLTLPKTFQIAAENGSVRPWVVRVKELNAKKSITGVTLYDSDGNVIVKEAIEIDPDKKQVLITVPKGTVLTGIAAVPDLSPGAKLIAATPAEEEKEEEEDTGHDFTQAPLKLTVEAQDGTSQVWTVDIEKNGENDITGILLKAGDDTVSILSYDLDIEEKELVLTVPRNTDLSAVTASLDLSADAELVDGSLGIDGLWSVEGLDFTRTQYFTVVAQNGVRQIWAVKVEYDTSSILGLNVELAGDYDVKFGFSYPNHKDNGGEPDYEEYDYDIAYNSDGTLNTANPIRLSYFVTDNAIYEGNVRKTYYNTLVVSAPGFTGVEWKIDGRDAPSNNSTPTGPSYLYVGAGNGDYSYKSGSYDSVGSGNGSYVYVSGTTAGKNILTIRAKDWFLESTHTVVFIGTRDYVKYSGTFEFKVVEKEGEAAE